MTVPRRLRLGYTHFLIVCTALLVVTGFRIALIFFKYKTIAQRIRLRTLHRSDQPEFPQAAAWAVRQASRVVPFASCLTQALSLQYILANHGQDSLVRVGVRVDKFDTVHAHAWVIHKDAILLGGSEEKLSQYSAIADLSPIPDV